MAFPSWLLFPTVATCGSVDVRSCFKIWNLNHGRKIKFPTFSHVCLLPISYLLLCFFDNIHNSIFNLLTIPMALETTHKSSDTYHGSAIRLIHRYISHSASPSSPLNLKIHILSTTTTSLTITTSNGLLFTIHETPTTTTIPTIHYYPPPLPPSSSTPSTTSDPPYCSPTYSITPNPGLLLPSTYLYDLHALLTRNLALAASFTTFTSFPFPRSQAHYSRWRQTCEDWKRQPGGGEDVLGTETMWLWALEGLLIAVGCLLEREEVRRVVVSWNGFGFLGGRGEYGEWEVPCRLGRVGLGGGGGGVDGDGHCWCDAGVGWGV
ncbi:hypothetical protein BJ508DRAFT_363688 [Ascobolus immersus RN42]|uniref:Uncharacterized protein n=1 Tax=Ascobolus immersus RN42 TaxID=1160509 RepID=A0A3N4HXU5_ASCIM|nr:hypothetical protein BJ508DRAFT_363688 [Ascobolus immersus RN42]